MKLLRGFNNTGEYRGGFLSIGNFDGVHRGHQAMFAALARQAREHQVPSVVFTFEPHPIDLLRPGQAPPAITTLDQKATLIDAGGVDFLIVYPTDRALLQLTAAEFFQQIVQHELRARGLVEGPNFCFGRNRNGNTDTLRELCEKTGLLLEIVPPVFVGEQMVSSSVVRKLLLSGAVADAAECLGHSYQVLGTVSSGAQRGRTIGFPTANLTQVKTLLPRDGVYAGVAHTDGRCWPAAINLGPNPTFGEQRQKLEVHLIGYQGDLYGQPLAVDFVARVRDTQPFPSLEALKEQIQQDVQTVLKIVPS